MTQLFHFWVFTHLPPHTHTHTHTHTMKVYLPIKKKDILPLETSWMDLEGNMLSEISQTEKDKYKVISHICII